MNLKQTLKNWLFPQPKLEVVQTCFESRFKLLPKGSPHSAGYDLMPVAEWLKVEGISQEVPFESLQIYPNQTKKFTLGFKAYFPEYEPIVSFLLPRSGKGSDGFVIGNLVGVIDCDYQGNWILQVWNRTDDTLTIKAFEPIAQVVFLPIIDPNILCVDSFSVETSRGTKGGILK